MFGKLFDPRLRAWRKKQRAAHPARYYGDGGTIHASGHLDIVTDPVTHRVTEVWFRCQELPFIVTHRGAPLGKQYGSIAHLPMITGVEVLDR